jgi:hypothetical protein
VCACPSVRHLRWLHVPPQRGCLRTQQRGRQVRALTLSRLLRPAVTQWSTCTHLAVIVDCVSSGAPLERAAPPLASVARARNGAAQAARQVSTRTHELTHADKARMAQTSHLCDCSQESQPHHHMHSLAGYGSCSGVSASATRTPSPTASTAHGPVTDVRCGPAFGGVKYV